MNNKRSLPLVAALVAAMMSLAACGTDSGTPQSNDIQPVGEFNADSQATCFTQLDDKQRAELQQYVSQHSDQIDSTTTNTDGTQNICVLEDDGNGGYNQHYYKQEDKSNFNDYLLYSMMLGRSNALMTYGLLSGDLDVGDAMLLSLLTGVNNQGQMFRPYSYDNDNRNWNRRPAPMSGQLRNVTYGAKATPRPAFDNSKMLPVPPEFQSPLPPVSDKVAEFKKDASGKSVKTSEKATGAKEAIKAQKAPAQKAPAQKAPVQKAPAQKAPAQKAPAAPKAPAPKAGK